MGAPTIAEGWRGIRIQRAERGQRGMAVQEGVRKSGDSERSWGILWNLHLKFIFFTASLRCEKGNEM